MSEEHAGGPGVLIVEDTGPSAHLFAELVRLSGGCPIVATTGQEALDAVCSRCFSLIIMDLRLPDGDGRDWAKRLRDEAGVTAEIWACSGLDANELIESAWDDMPFSAWIQKPFDVAEIRHKLSIALQGT